VLGKSPVPILDYLTAYLKEKETSLFSCNQLIRATANIRFTKSANVSTLAALLGQRQSAAQGYTYS
jgi:hypothetical protein